MTHLAVNCDLDHSAPEMMEHFELVTCNSLVFVHSCVIRLWSFFALQVRTDQLTIQESSGEVVVKWLATGVVLSVSVKLIMLILIKMYKGFIDWR